MHQPARGKRSQSPARDMRGLWRTGLVTGGAFAGGGPRAPHGAGGFSPVLLPRCAARFGRCDAGSAGLEGQPVCGADGRRAAVPGAGGAVCESGASACGKDCGADGGQFRFSQPTITVKLHGCALRRGVGGDRKAPDSPPQRRNPLLAIICCFFRHSDLSALPYWSLPCFQRAFRSPSGLLRRSPLMQIELYCKAF